MLDLKRSMRHGNSSFGSPAMMPNKRRQPWGGSRNNCMRTRAVRSTWGRYTGSRMRGDAGRAPLLRSARVRRMRMIRQGRRRSPTARTRSRVRPSGLRPSPTRSICATRTSHSPARVPRRRSDGQRGRPDARADPGRRGLRRDHSGHHSREETEGPIMPGEISSVRALHALRSHRRRSPQHEPPSRASIREPAADRRGPLGVHDPGRRRRLRFKPGPR
jgi:hypothetical protein